MLPVCPNRKFKSRRLHMRASEGTPWRGGAHLAEMQGNGTIADEPKIPAPQGKRMGEGKKGKTAAPGPVRPCTYCVQFSRTNMCVHSKDC